MTEKDKKQSRMGSDPLAFIKDSREESKLSKQNTHSKQSIQQEEKEEVPSSEKGLKDGWTRATYIVKKDYKQKLKDIAYWERKDIKDVLNEALKEYLNKKQKVIKVINEASGKTID